MQRNALSFDLYEEQQFLTVVEINKCLCLLDFFADSEGCLSLEQ